MPHNPESPRQSASPAEPPHEKTAVERSVAKIAALRERHLTELSMWTKGLRSEPIPPKEAFDFAYKQTTEWQELAYELAGVDADTRKVLLRKLGY